MVTITTTKTTEEKPFPKLMKSKSFGDIIFFTEPQKGLQIKKGYWYEEWDMDYFEDYNDPVMIKNEQIWI